ncbi:hypothetical protein [Streptomyces sp. NPDC059909]|uniref:hypothetical protein n=1 Tax=Streptomyces sp. NPDC059909 TaxID=3346998 RepID=UPI00364A478F
MGGAGGNWTSGGGRQTYSPYGSTSRSRSGAFFSLMRSWAVGLVAFYGSGYLLGLATESFATADALDSFGMRFLLIYLPNSVATLLGVLAAARLHREPHRVSPVLHFFAALGVPLFALVRTLLSGWGIIGIEGMGMLLATVVLGGFCGLLIDRLLESRTDTNAGYSWGDSGATAMEYLGTVLVVVAVIGGMAATGVGGRIAERLKAQICRLTGGSCEVTTEADGKPLTDADFEPGLCNTRNISGTAGHEVKLGWFKLGNEYGFQKQDFKKRVIGKDGKPKDVPRYRITFSEAGKLGASWKPKFGMEAGKFDEKPYEVELEGGFKMTSGDTFEFDSAKERDAFLEKLDSRAGAKAQMQYGRDFASVQGAKRYMELDEEINKTVKGKKISYGTAAAEGTANGNLELSSGESDDLSTKLGGKIKASPSVTLTRDTINGIEGTTYTFELEGGGDVDLSGGGSGAKSGISGKRSATVTVNRDINHPDKLLSIVTTQTVQGKGSGKVSRDKSKEGKTENEDGKKDKGKVSGNVSADATQTETVTNIVRFQDGKDGMEHDRKIAENWLSGNGQGKTEPFTTLFGDTAPTKAPKPGDNFENLMFNKGRSSRTTYTGVTNSAEFGFEVNLAAAAVGYKATFSKETQQIGEAEFLGAPREGKREYVPFSLCAQ